MGLASYTRALIITEVRRQLQERMGALFTAPDLERWADLAVVDIASKTRCLRTEATANTVSAQQGYTIPADCLGAWAVSRLDYLGKPLELHPWDNMYEKVPTGMALSSTGTPKWWSPYGRTVRLFPIPNASANELRIWYAKIPASFSADSVALTDLGFPETYGPAVEDFMVQRGYLLKGDSARSQAHGQAYLQSVAMASGKRMPDVPEDETRGSG